MAKFRRFRLLLLIGLLAAMIGAGAAALRPTTTTTSPAAAAAPVHATLASCTIYIHGESSTGTAYGTWEAWATSNPCNDSYYARAHYRCYYFRGGYYDHWTNGGTKQGTYNVSAAYPSCGSGYDSHKILRGGAEYYYGGSWYWLCLTLC